MRKTITLVALLAALFGGLWLFMYKRKEIMTVVNEKVAEAKGFDKARTPQQAIDFFKKAIQERDYETAARYCTPKYAEQLRKCAKGATKLGKKIDDVRVALDKRGLASDTTRIALELIEPFPPDFETLDVQYKEGDDKAVATIGERITDDLEKGRKVLQWRFDMYFCRALAKSLGNPWRIGLKREGEGENKEWKLDIPVDGALIRSVDRFNKKHMDYYNALDVVDQDIKNDATTRFDVEGRMKGELEKCLD